MGGSIGTVPGTDSVDVTSSHRLSPNHCPPWWLPGQLERRVAVHARGWWEEKSLKGLTGPFGHPRVCPAGSFHGGRVILFPP